MPRPSRCRRVCAEPLFSRFGPLAGGASGPQAEPSGRVVLFVDEYEAVRIVDLLKRSHEECAARMQISRTTATEIYERARFKIADAIVNGRELVIEGGRYRVCTRQESEAGCRCPGCCRQRTGARGSLDLNALGGCIMKVAVPFFEDQVFGHFGKAPAMKIYTIADGAAASSEVVPASGHGHAAMVNLLVKNNVDAVICGGIGGGAAAALAQAGIRLYAGAAGSADAAVEALIAGALKPVDASAASGCCGHHHGASEEGCCGGHEDACGCRGHEDAHAGDGGCGCGGHGHGRGHGHGHCHCGGHGSEN